MVVTFDVVAYAFTAMYAAVQYVRTLGMPKAGSRREGVNNIEIMALYGAIFFGSIVAIIAFNTGMNATYNIILTRFLVWFFSIIASILAFLQVRKNQRRNLLFSRLSEAMFAGGVLAVVLQTLTPLV